VGERIRRAAFFVAALAVLAAGPVHAQLRVVTYNTFSSGSTAAFTEPRAAIGTVFAGLAAQNRPGFAGPLDIVLLQEQENVATTALFRDLLNTTFGTATYASGTLNGASTGGGRPGVVYNSSAVELIAETAVNVTSSTGAARATIRYQFRPVGYDAAADFYVYNSHFKASDTTDDRSRRGVEAAQIRSNADALGAGVLAVYVGDMNLYRSTEAAFVNLTGTGNGQAFDPIDRVGSWTGGASFKDVHTQSPVTTSQFGGQVAGGLNDRFDFQLVTGGLLDGRGLDYIPGSYWAFGNTGSHVLSGALSSGSSAAGLRQYLPGYSESQAADVISAIMASSDHLPVVADYKLPARLAVTAPVLSGTALRNAALSGTFTVTNAAPARFAAGAETLDYTISAAGGLTASGSGSRPALSTAASHAFTVATASAGTRSGTLTVATSSPQAAAAAFTRAYTVEVLDTAQLQRIAYALPGAAFTGTFSFTGSTGHVASLPYNGGAIGDAAVGALVKVGVTSSSNSGNSRASQWPTGATTGSDAFTGAVDLGKYFEFTLTADPGHVLDMDSLTFGVGRSATGPRQWQWRSSVDGFAAAIDTYTSVHAGLTRSGGILANPDSDSSWTGNVLDLSAAAFQGLEALTLRFYGFNAEGTGGTGGLQGPLSFAGDVVTVTDSVPATIGPGGFLRVSNAAAAAGTQRAAASIASRVLSGAAGWSVSGLDVGTTVAAAATLSGTVSFAAAGRLNGTYTGTLTLGLEHAAQSLPGAAPGDLGTLSWNLSTTVVGNTGSGTAAVGAGQTYAGLGIGSSGDPGRLAQILAGTAATARTVSMSFAAAPVGSSLASGALSLQGTSGDALVLSLSYDAAVAAGLGPNVFLGWLDTRDGSGTAGQWINAVLGNSTNAVSLETGYAGSWAAYVGAFSVSGPAQALGAWGYDVATTTAWAVIDHNSQFGVVAAVPEPTAGMLAAIGLVGWLATARRRRAAARRPSA